MYTVLSARLHIFYLLLLNLLLEFQGVSLNNLEHECDFGKALAALFLSLIMPPTLKNAVNDLSYVQFSL